MREMETEAKILFFKEFGGSGFQIQDWMDVYFLSCLGN